MLPASGLPQERDGYAGIAPLTLPSPLGGEGGYLLQAVRSGSHAGNKDAAVFDAATARHARAAWGRARLPLPDGGEG
ncbi:MAG: hypothetical protein RIR62_1275, partial [Pseudomonadota bacterium]